MPIDHNHRSGCVGEAAILRLLVAALLGAMTAPTVAARDDRNDRAIRVRIERLERDVKEFQGRQAAAKKTMDAAVAEGQKVKPELDAAEREQSAARGALSVARQANAEAIRKAREKAATDPSVRSAKEKLDVAVASRDEIARELNAEIEANPTYQQTAAEVARAERSLEAAKASGNAEARATAAIELNEARNRLSAFRQVALLENEEYRVAVEFVAQARFRYEAATKAAIDQQSDLSSVSASGEAVGYAEKDYREAQAKTARLRGKFSRAKSVHARAQRSHESASREIRKLQNEISDLRAALNRRR